MYVAYRRVIGSGLLAVMLGCATPVYAGSGDATGTGSGGNGGSGGGGAAPVVTIVGPHGEKGSSSVYEGTGSGRTHHLLHVKIDTCPTIEEIRIKIKLYNGTANNSDYKNKTYVASFSQGSCNKDVAVDLQINKDGTYENDEYFDVKLSNDKPGSIQPFNYDNDTHRVWILNDDAEKLDIKIRKFANEKTSSQHVNKNDIVTFKLEISNNTPILPSPVEVTDTIPSAFHILDVTDNIASGFDCHVAGQTVTCGGPYKLGNGKIEVLIKTKVVSDTLNKVTNTGEVVHKSTYTETYLNNNKSSVTLYTNTNGFDFKKRIDGQEGYVTRTINDTVRVSLQAVNSTDNGVTVKLEDNIKNAGASNDTFVFDAFVGSAQQACTYSNKKVVCDQVSVPAHQSVTYEFDVKLAKASNRKSNSCDMYVQWNKAKMIVDGLVRLDDSAGVKIRRINHAPQISQPIGDITFYYLMYNEALIGIERKKGYQVSDYFHDQDYRDRLDITFEGLPDGLKMEKENVGGESVYKLAGVPTQKGTFTVTVRARDCDGATATQVFTLTVTTPQLHATDNHYPYPGQGTQKGNVIMDDTGDGVDTGQDIHVVRYDDLNKQLKIFANGNFKFTPTNYNPSQSLCATYTIRDMFNNEDTAALCFTVDTNGSSPGVTYGSTFTIVNPPETRNIIGNFVMTGNTVLCITDSQSDYNGTCIDDNTVTNNTRMVRYIDIDNDAGTWNSSTASFTLPDSLDNSGTDAILWAGLFWQGSVNNYYSGRDGNVNIQRRAYVNNGSVVYKNIVADESIDINASDARRVKFKIDNGDYLTVEVGSFNDDNQTFYYDNKHGNEGASGGYYAAYKNITSLVRSLHLSPGEHNITVANVVTNEGMERRIGNYAGWTLVVIYKETFGVGLLRNVSVFNGYFAIDMNHQERRMHISGFRLPRKDDIDAKVGMFIGEGEFAYGKNGAIESNITDELFLSLDAFGTGDSVIDEHATNYGNVFDARFDNIDRPAVGDNRQENNTNGIDIDIYDISSLMETYRDNNPHIDNIYIGLASRPTGGNDTNDYVTPSMVVFSAQLFQPELCYDYSYKQNGVTFTEENNGSKYPAIRAEKLFSLSPVTVELYIRNNEESDAILRNVKVDVYDINTSYASYRPESVYVVEPKSVVNKHIPDSELQTAAEYVKGIPVGDIEAKDYTYIDYSLDPAVVSDVNISINVRLNMTLDLLSGVTYPINGYPLESMPICGDVNNTYGVEYGRFNVEDEGISPANGTPVFNLPTQVVRRIGRFGIRSYDAQNNETPLPVATMVAVEVIDVEKYHDKVAACMEPDNHLSPRIWIPFVDVTQPDGNTSYVYLNGNTVSAAISDLRTSAHLLQNGTFDTSEMMFEVARRAAAFRIYYPVDADGYLGRIEHVSGDNWRVTDITSLRNGAAECTRPVLDIETGSLTSSVDQVCDGVGTGSSLRKIASCMECLVGHSTEYVCSRDMFAVRPKAYRLVLSDRDAATNDVREIVRNDTTDTTNIVAGYDYAVEVNATRYDDEKASAGYMVSFKEDGEDGNRTFTFAWQDVTGHDDCIVKDDFNQTITFLDGYGKSDNTKAGDIGVYLLRLRDKVYTRVDWDPAYRKHITGKAHFLQGRDCVANTSIVTDKEALSVNVNGNIGNTNGCEIRSALDTDFTDLKLHLYPYGFAMDLSADRGPVDDNASIRYIYVNPVPLWRSDNRRMSFNIYGSYRAIGKDGNATRNFTDGCWGDDTLLSLTMAALKPDTAPSQTPNLSYALRDFNATDPDVAYRPTTGGEYERSFDVFNPHTDGTLVVEQGVAFYPKETEGRLGIELLINYDRTYNTPLDPRLIRFDDFNISYKTQPTDLHADMIDAYAVRSSMTIDKNATFIYGRAMPGRFFYDNVTDDSVTTPIYIVAYCSLDITECTAAGLYSIAGGMLQDAQSGESGWWIVQNHDGQREGNVTLVSTGGDVVPQAPASPVIDNGVARDVTVTNTSGTVPTVVFVDLETAGSARWLIYNRNFDGVPMPFYKVRFIGKGDWTGYGQTGHVVGDDINPVKIRRLEW